MQISQPPMVQIGKFQCLSYSEFPDFFKTHPTLNCRSIVQASRSLQTNRQCYLIALVIQLCMLMIFLENISVWSIQEVLSIIKVDFLHEKKQDILGIQLFALNAHKISIIHPFFQKYLNTPKFQNSYLHSQFSDKRKQLLVQTFSVFFPTKQNTKKSETLSNMEGRKKYQYVFPIQYIFPCLKSVLAPTRSSRCHSVCPFSTSLSRALNLHLSGSYLEV